MLKKKNTRRDKFCVQRDDFGGFLPIPLGNAGRDNPHCWGTLAGWISTLLLQGLGWNGSSLSPDTFSSQPSRKHESLALPLSLSTTTLCSRSTSGLGMTTSVHQYWLGCEDCQGHRMLYEQPLVIYHLSSIIIKPCNSGRKTKWYWGSRWDMTNCIYRNEYVSDNSWDEEN